MTRIIFLLTPVTFCNSIQKFKFTQTKILMVVNNELKSNIDIKRGNIIIQQNRKIAVFNKLSREKDVKHYKI